MNWTLLRDTLVDGLLVRDGYVDRQKLERYFALDEPVFMEQTPDILTYMCAEVWLRQCNDVRKAAGPCNDPSRQAVA